MTQPPAPTGNPISDAPRIGRTDLYLQAAPFAREAVANGQFKPRRDIAPWPLNFPLDWTANPFNEGNWQFQLHAWRMMDPIIAAYFEDRDSRRLEAAFKFIEDWNAFHVEQEKEAQYSWYDMAVGIRALRLAFFMDAVRSGVFEADQARVTILENLSSSHIEFLKDWKNLGNGNHGLFQAAGLALLCECAPHLPESEGGIERAQAIFDHVMADQFTSQGVHTENSPGYHFFAINVTKKIPVLKRLNSEAWFREAENVSPWLTLPDRSLVPVGDTEGSEKGMETDPSAVASLADGRTFAVGPYNQSGYGIVRSLPSAGSGQSMLFVQGMAHNLIHKHADDLSFILYEFDMPIFVEAGKYGYKSDKWRKYAQSAAAHNTIGLAKKHFNGLAIETGGSHIGPTKLIGDAFVTWGAYRRPKLFDHERIFRYVPGISLDIEDSVANRTNDRIVSSLHLHPSLAPQMNGSGFTVDLPNGKTMVVSFLGEGDLTAHRGEDDPVLGWYSASYLRMEPLSTIRATCPPGTAKLGWSVQFE